MKHELAQLKCTPNNVDASQCIHMIRIE